MLSLKAQDWYTITGRGLMAAIGELPEGFYDPRQISKGERVLIDGTPYTVRGVEAFAVFCSPEHPYRHPFSLLVKEEDVTC
jgi:hypothetical protein